MPAVQPPIEINGVKLWKIKNSDRFYSSKYIKIRRDTLVKSLFTTDYNEAVSALSLRANGYGPNAVRDPLCLDVLTAYGNWLKLEGKTDISDASLRDAFSEFLPDLRISKLGYFEQGSIVEAFSYRGLSLGTGQQYLGRLKRACEFAFEFKHRDGLTLSTFEAAIGVSKYRCEALGLTHKRRQTYQPERPDLYQAFRYFKGLEPMRRYLFLAVAMAGRPSAICAVDGTHRLRADVLSLLPPEDVQNNKRRVTLPLSSRVAREIDSFGAGPFVGITPEEVRKHMLRMCEDLGYTYFVPYSIRHFMVTYLLGCHAIFDVPRVSQEERLLWMGHAEQGTNALYGVFPAAYLDHPMQAVAKLLDDIHEHTGAVFLA